MEVDMQQLTDWRGRPIEVGTNVIWRQGTTGRGRWALGTVTEIRADQYRPYGPGTLDIAWSEQSNDYGNDSGKARGVAPYNVTVWTPEEAATA
jgi:hypothetical protein